MERILGLFAHPDDEIFCAGGLLAAKAAEGAEIMVVSFTRGQAGRIGHVDLATRRTIGALREAELVAACGVLGITDTRCLDFADGSLADVDRDELVAAAVALIDDFRPDTVISFDDTGAYGHPDHIAVCEVAEAACAVSAADNGTVTRLLQATFPRRDQLLLNLLVDWLGGLPERFHGTDTFVNALLMFADSSSMLGFASDHMRVEWFPAGSFIIEQGEPADSLYLLLSGSVEVFREHGDGELAPVGTVGVGEFIGETGLAHGAERNAHCVASSDCACFVLTASEDASWKPRGAPSDALVATTGDGDDGCERSVDELVVDVGDLVDRKVKALGCHRSQYTIEPGLFPQSMLVDLLGSESFREVVM